MIHFFVHLETGGKGTIASSGRTEEERSEMISTNTEDQKIFAKVFLSEGERICFVLLISSQGVKKNFELRHEEIEREKEELKKEIKLIQWNRDLRVAHVWNKFYYI